MLVVEAAGGGQFGQQTIDALESMDTMVAFCFDDYGEKTSSAYCSFFEVKYAMDYGKPVLPLKLYGGVWPPAGGGEGTKGFSQNKFFFTAERKFFTPPSWDESWQPMACAQKLVEELAKQFPHRNLVPDGVRKSIGERL